MPILNRYTHMRTFPLNYEISTYGVCRKRVGGTFKYFSTIEEPTGTYVFIPDRKEDLQKCLVAELILLSFNSTYTLGDQIKYKDGNIHNIYLENLRHRKLKSIFPTNRKMVEESQKGMWNCDSRAYNANSRSAAKGMIITGDDVLRCLLVCKFRCFYCEKGLNPHSWQLDHHIPLSGNGTNEFNNLRASCKYCNTMKSDMVYDQWMSKIHNILHVYVKHYPDHEFRNFENEGFAKIV